jgi:aspartyl-tRNA(Asn)/glutamyl-tRNA(Gln) amidotransferase subunit C
MAEKVTIDRARVMHVAKLAALSLSDAEADKLADELRAIVAFIDSLDELDALDTTDVPPTAYVHMGESAWREDDVRVGLTREEALAQAPRVEDGGFAVPAFLEG